MGVTEWITKEKGQLLADAVLYLMYSEFLSLCFFTQKITCPALGAFKVVVDHGNSTIKKDVTPGGWIPPWLRQPRFPGGWIPP
jgi:hypothetical protein